MSMSRTPSEEWEKEWAKLAAGGVVGLTIQIGRDIVLPACVAKKYLCILVDDSFLIRDWIGNNKPEILATVREQGFEVREIKLYVLSHN